MYQGKFRMLIQQTLVIHKIGHYHPMVNRKNAGQQKTEQTNATEQRLNL